jgi:hypothetical protein
MMAPCSWREASVPGRTSSISRVTLKMCSSASALNCWLLTTCLSGSASQDGAVRFSRPGCSVGVTARRAKPGPRPRGAACMVLQGARDAAAAAVEFITPRPPLEAPLFIDCLQ